MEKKGAVRQRQSLVDMLRRRDPAGDIPFDADESEEELGMRNEELKFEVK